ncbi:cobalamin biosynthesis protein CobD [Peptostreptococcaceae bacterium AS15]|nr:cobalamin biosynthesis protein CobD [Peptostreptococcaceae bacterium AS15]
MIPYFILISAYVLDLIFGDPYSFPHPVKFIGNMIARLEKFFFSTSINKLLSGLMTFLIVVVTTYFATFLLINISYSLNSYLGIAVEILLTYTVLSAKCLEVEAVKVQRELRAKNLENSRKSLSYIVGRDTKELDFAQIIKAVIETVAENTVDGVISPIFYLCLGGVPLAMAFKAISTLDSMIGYRNEKYEEFGKVSARADDVANFIPARLSIIFFTISAFLLRLDYKNAFLICMRDRKNHLSPNCAYSESLIAGALGIQLGGSHYYGGRLVEKQKIGDDLRKADVDDITKTVNMLRIVTFLSVLTVCIINIFISGF